MTDTVEGVVHIGWDERGYIVAGVDAGETAQLLDATSEGRLRRMLAVHVTLPAATAIEASLDVVDPAAAPIVRRA